jgi:DNA-binding MarR family transcriptional regulator
MDAQALVEAAFDTCQHRAREDHANKRRGWRMTKNATEESRVDPIEISGSPGHLIRRCQQIAVAIFLDEFRDFAFTPMQYAALATIQTRPGIDQRTLVNLIAIDRSTVGAILGGLEKRQLISRITPKHNQRIKQLFIMPLGEDLLNRSRDRIPRLTDRILGPLEPDDRATFLRLMAQLVDGNNEQSRAPVKLDE